ncbi:hypothetical protein C6502_05540 [Candidatus Poribacteria bacterium]|nr:MAG: hypothetical protein C6502_05540 [Candidatus Poribacteria bacterium]
MKNVSFFRNVCIVFLVVLAVCKADGQAPEATPAKPAKLTVVKPANIVVVLDVSDRLKKDKQIERDIKIIRYIVAHFQETFVKAHINKGRRAGPYRHRLIFAVPEQPVPIPESSAAEHPKPYKVPSAIMEKLKIRDSGRMLGFDEFKIKRDMLLQEIGKLYEFVQRDNPYTGADIWQWFKEDAAHYLREGSHNYIICLSDGYLKFTPAIEEELKPGEFMEVGPWRDKEDWINHIIHLLPTKKDFSKYDITFLMIEINLHRDKKSGKAFPYDFDIIKAHWEPWLESMGIKDPKFELQVPEEVLGDVISSFLVPHQGTK